MSQHVLMFGWEYPPIHLGGLGVACQGLVRGLLANGTKVTLVLPHPNDGSGDNVDILSPADTAATTVKVKSFLQPYDTAEFYAKRMENIPRETGQIYGEDLHEAIHHYTEASIALTAELSPDVIHCHDWMTYEVGVRAARHHRRPLVAHIHATELDRTHFQPHQWIYDQERRGFELADHIIAVSGYTRDILVREYGVSADKISVVHNSADILLHDAPPAAITNAQKQHPLVLFLGRLTIQKGAVQFLEMARTVHRMRPDVQFVVAGDGGLLPELMNRACELGLDSCMTFAGKVDTPEAMRLFRRADCFVMPSLSEPFGIVALEAIAHGTPVVLSKQSGAGEVIGHAFKVDFWDTDLMADCVLTILREQPLAEQLKAEAPRVLQHLTWKHQAGLVQSVYRNVTRTRRS